MILQLKPSAPRSEHGFERRDVDAVLTLVVGRAAAIDAFAFDGDFPRRQAGAPQIVEAANGVAVAVDQRRDEIRILDALGDQHRRT
jgi:hypothetical protein